jgi:hypothetical protein
MIEAHAGLQALTASRLYIGIMAHEGSLWNTSLQRVW